MSQEEKKMIPVTQSADLTKPVKHTGDAPFYIRTLCQKTVYSTSGVIQQDVIEDYIRISALPDDIKDRVKTFIGSFFAGSGRV